MSTNRMINCPFDNIFKLFENPFLNAVFVYLVFHLDHYLQKTKLFSCAVIFWLWAYTRNE